MTGVGKASRAKRERRDLDREINAEIEADNRLDAEQKAQLRRYNAKRGMGIVGNLKVPRQVRLDEADRLVLWVMYHPMAEATRYAIRYDVGDVSGYSREDFRKLMLEICEEQVATGIVLAFDPVGAAD